MLGLIGLAMLMMIIVTPYRLERLTSFMNPQANPVGVNMQSIQGKYALGSGGWFGVGLGASREKWGWVPNATTDYIFSIIGEELGLVGTIAVLALFGAIGYAGLRVAVHATDPFVRYASGGVTSWLMVQALVNVGAVLGILPITGVPLPLVSYGGSALVPALLGLGMLLSFARAGRSGHGR
jgi:cell division protein FtsW